MYLKIFRFNSNNKRGFTFIEVLYAIIILAGVIASIAELTSGSSKNIRASSRYHTIALLMESKLSELELQYQKEGPEILENTEEEKFKDHPDYSWKLETQNIELIQPTSLEVDLVEDNQFTQVMEDTVDKFSEIISEVTLTIYYTTPKRKASYPISTYFIDFKKIKEPGWLDIPIPTSL